MREPFSATLALDSVLGINTDAEVAKRVREAVATLERTVSRIRMTATGLEPERGTDPT